MLYLFILEEMDCIQHDACRISASFENDRFLQGMKKSRSWLTPVLGLFRRKSNQVHLPDDNEKDVSLDLVTPIVPVA